MNHEYADKLITLLENHHNSDNQEAMEAYMRNQFPFFGIRTPERNALLKDFLKENGKPDRKSTRLNSSHTLRSRMPSSA